MSNINGKQLDDELIVTEGIGNINDLSTNQLNFSKPSGISAIDQSQLVDNASSADSDQWQSVTQGVTGCLDKVTIQNNSGLTATSVIVTIYEGIGSGGVVLSQETGITAPHNTLTDVILTTKPFLKNTDTLSIGVSGTNWAWAINTAGGYGGGSFKGGPNDAIFKTFVDTGFGSKLTNTGINTINNQPYFLADMSSFPTNVTGTGLPYTAIFNNEITDRDNIYDNATGIVTVKTEGIYDFVFGVQLTDFVGTPTRAFAQILTSNFTYQLQDLEPTVCASNGNLFFLNGSIPAEMDIGDTCKVNIIFGGGTLTVDINPAFVHYFTGCLKF
jgi:hypothetical protein